MADKKIGDYELVDRGINTASYFSGAGTAFTKWDDCFTGIGSTPSEAADDAIEMAAQSGWDVTDIEVNVADFPDNAGEDVGILHYEDCPLFDDPDADEECECDGEAPEFYVVLYVEEAVTSDV